jgi:hypothetical protein
MRRGTQTNEGGGNNVRSIVLFQTIVNIILGGAIVFLLNQVEGDVEDMVGLERTAAQSLDEALKMNETLLEILATLKANDVSGPAAGTAQ